MIWDTEISTSRRTCMLMVTHACNLNCSYCYESYKQNAYMDIDFAKNIISKEAEIVSKSDIFDELEIDFMGGEPFMNFPLIKEIVEWLERGAIAVPWVCFATTNATLLTDAIKDWLRKHKQHIVLGASYDGNSEMQTTNRGTDKYNMDLDFFSELWPEQGLHMTISKETLPMLAKGVLDIQKKGHHLEAALAEGLDWTIEDALLYREQLCVLKDFYLNNPEFTPFCRLARYVNVFDAPAEERVQEKYCGTGKYMATYDIDGQKYGCHMFTPVVQGRDRALLSDCVEWDSKEANADEYCKNCVLRSFCPTCPGFNYKYRGHVAIRDRRRCYMVLAEALTACEFQIERIALIDVLDSQDAQYGQAALRAYNVLKNFDLERSKSPYTV